MKKAIISLIAALFFITLDGFGALLNDSGAGSIALNSAGIAALSSGVATAGVTFDEWREAHFTPEQLERPEISGEGADPAGDGVGNFLKFAFGLDPFTPVTPGDFLEPRIVDGKLELGYFARTGAEGIEYVPEASANLVDWHSGPEHVEVAIEPLPEGDLSRVTARALLDGGEESAFLRVAVRTTAGGTDPSPWEAQLGEPVRALLGDITVRIPADFPTLQEAIDELSGTVFPTRGARIFVTIQSGHRPSSGIAVEGGDFGHFWIRSEDPEVRVAGDFSGDFLRGTYARLPVLDALIDMNGRGGDGVHVRESSSARIMPWAGIRNAGENGVFGWTSSIYMERAVVTGARIHNLRVSTSHVHARFSNLSGAGEHNIRASYGSSVRATFCNLSNAGLHGVYVIRSRVIAEASDIRYAGAHAVFANRGSNVHLTVNNQRTDLSHAGQRGIFATNASTVEGQEVIIHNAGQEGVRAQQHSTVSIREARIQGCHRAVVSTGGSRVEILNGLARESRGPHDLVVLNGGVLIATGAQTTNGQPALVNTNVGAFNVHTAQGVIYD